MRHHDARTEAQEPIHTRCSRPVLICSGPPSVSLRSRSSFICTLKIDTVLVEHGAAKLLRSYPHETLGHQLLLGPLNREPGQFELQVAMGSIIHTTDISHFGSTFGRIRKHHTTIAAALLVTTLVLLPVYLVLGQRQQKIDLRRLDSSYQVFCSQVKSMQEAHLPIQSHACCS